MQEVSRFRRQLRDNALRAAIQRRFEQFVPLRLRSSHFRFEAFAPLRDSLLREIRRRLAGRKLGDARRLGCFDFESRGRDTARRFDCSVVFGAPCGSILLDEELARAKASLVEIEQAAARINDFPGHVDTATREKLDQLNRQLQAILESEVQSLGERGEA